ncbi:hypothetical protein [Stappia sp. 28M-7]|uniref:hypothetical protein n=1 Tax=Stappia sp. 28M-7 TaxID=2762596 RepID=UPI00163BCF2D|nr:hypothetical protein [Stappia sp. 28M-7]MBC2859867.1 hypothetical protein [Stappia sp. 28M-7]
MDRKSRQDAARRQIIERLDAAIARLAPYPELDILGSRLAAIREIAALQQAAGELADGLAEQAQEPYHPLRRRTDTRYAKAGRTQAGKSGGKAGGDPNDKAE